MRFLPFLLCLLLLVMVAPLRAGDELLTNQDVIELFKAGLGTELIAKKITTTENAFTLSPKAMIELKKNNVPDQIIELMLQESMKSQKKFRARIALDVQNLASPNSDIKRKAFARLRALGDAATPQIVEALGSNVPEVRAAAASALGDLGDKSAVERLQQLLTDPDQPVRYAAAYSLALLQDETALALARQNISSGTGPLDGFLKLAGLRKDLEYTGFISIRLLKDTDPQTRAMAAWALGEIDSKKALPSLEDALQNDRELEVKKAAALALGKIKAPTSFDIILTTCREVPAVRKEALIAIGQFPVELSAPFLVGALEQPLTPEQKTEVLNALRRLTGRDYGEDIATWRKWLQENKFKQASAPATPAVPITPTATMPANSANPASPVSAPAKAAEETKVNPAGGQ